MTQSRLRLLGVCILALSLMALSSSAARATTGAHWWILDASGTVEIDAAILETPVALSTDNTGVLHSKIAGISVLFECTTMAAVNAQLLGNGSVGEKAGAVKGSKVKFSGCITKLNGSTSGACQPTASGIESGVINTNAGHGLIVLHELVSGVRHGSIQVLPDSGETLATIEMSKECAIGSKVPVIGKFFARGFTNASFETMSFSHLYETGPLTELWVISKTAEHVATTLGSALASLSGSHTGLSWSGEPA